MPDRKKVFLLDYPNFRTTRHWRDYLAANHDLVTDMYLDPIKAAWCDVLFVEWCEGAAQEVCRRGGHFNDVYDNAGLKGPRNAVHHGDWSWPNAKIFIRPIDIDIYAGHFRGVDWSQVSGLCYIAPHFGEMLKDGVTYPTNMKFEETRLSVRLDEWTWKERGPGKNIAWMAESWTAKDLPGAFYMIHALKRRAGWDDVKLHVVKNGQSNEAWFHRYCDHLLKVLKLEDNVVYHPRVPSVDAFLDDMNFVITTGRKEGFSLIVGESLAKGIKTLMMNWESSEAIWPRELICDTPDDMAEKIATGDYDSKRYLEYASVYSHDKEIARLREVTGL